MVAMYYTSLSCFHLSTLRCVPFSLWKWSACWGGTSCLPDERQKGGIVREVVCVCGDVRCVCLCVYLYTHTSIKACKHIHTHTCPNLCVCESCNGGWCPLFCATVPSRVAGQQVVHGGVALRKSTSQELFQGLDFSPPPIHQSGAEEWMGQSEWLDY
jgi:hypothetical protein